VRFRVISAVALVVAASVACDNTATNGVFTERDATIVMPGLSFSPDAVTIPVGGKVLWVGSGVIHNVAFGSTPGAPGGCPNWSVGDCLRQFDVAGAFGYVCTIPGHGSMVGLIRVE
jgi:plastocyanin